MGKDFHYKNYSSINDAMYISNTIMTTDKFTLLDYNLLCLVRSFYDSNKKFYMTNEQLSKIFFASERTVRYSIERLCKHEFLSKEFIENNRLKGRYLIYQKDNVERFIESMKIAANK